MARSDRLRRPSDGWVKGAYDGLKSVVDDSMVFSLDSPNGPPLLRRTVAAAPQPNPWPRQQTGGGMSTGLRLGGRPKMSSGVNFDPDSPSGVRNAAFLAVRILALQDAALAKALVDYKEKNREKILKKQVDL